MDVLPAMGIDFGDARIGIAATDPLGILSHPVETIHVSRTDPVKRIVELAAQLYIKTFVVGIPYRLDGTEGTATQKVERFIAQLRDACPDIAVEKVDERLTTTSAQEKMREAGRKARDYKEIIDQVAAVEILNSWMEEKGFFL